MSGSRILALDYGTKRIGVALSDELGWTAQPLETFESQSATFWSTGEAVMDALPARQQALGADR